LATRLQREDLHERIDCFGEFDRTDPVCLRMCSLNFDCAAARERLSSLHMDDQALEGLGCPHSA
jgi:hypothetical protein